MARSGGLSWAFVRLLGAGAAMFLAAAGCESENQPDVTPPAAVLDLSASATSTCSIALEWTAPGDDGLAGRSSAYDLRYATEAIDSDNWGVAAHCAGVLLPAASGSDEHLVVTGLLADTRYYFRMIATDECGNPSSVSNEASAVTMPPGSSPGVAWVRDGLANEDQDWTNLASQLSSAWAPVAGATGYQYSIGTAPGGRDVSDWSSPLVATAAVRSGLVLAPGGTYYFSVRGLIEGGCSGTGTSDGITVDTASPDSRARALAAYSCTSDFKVVWTGTDDLSGVSEYDVQSGDGSSGEWIDWISASTDTSAIFHGAEEQAYFFRSRARDAAGNQEAYPDDPDAWVSVRRAIPQVATVNDGVGADAAWANSATELSANWSPVQDVQGYEYGIGADPEIPNVVDWTQVWNESHMTHQGLSLSEGQLYFVFVRAFSGVCLGQWTRSNGVTVDVSPPASQVQALPETTYAQAQQGQAQFIVSWNGGDGLSGIGRYDVQSRTGLGEQWTNWRSGMTGTSSAFVGTVGNTYYFRCRATDRAGNVETYPDGYDTFTHLVQGSTPPQHPPINTYCKMALHMVPHGKSCKNLPEVGSVEGLNRVWSQLDGDGFDVFFVIFDFDSILTVEFGLKWPADWGTAYFWACPPVTQTGSIINPGDGVDLAYSTCQVPTTHGGTRPPFWTMCYLWFLPQSDGEIEIWPNPTSGDLCVIDCREPAFRHKTPPAYIYYAGVNVDPWEGSPG